MALVVLVELVVPVVLVELVVVKKPSVDFVASVVVPGSEEIVQFEKASKKIRSKSSTQGGHSNVNLQTFITLLSFGLQRIYYCKNVVLFNENSILLLSEYLESSEW